MGKSISELIEHFEEEFSSSDRVVGAGALILQGERVLSVLEKKDYWDKDGVTRISYQNVGGQVEDGENVYEALQREASEEIDCGLKIKGSEETILTGVDGACEKVKLEEEISPLLVSREKHPGKPGRPDAQGYWHLLGFLFRADLRGEPEPSREIPAVASIPPVLLDKQEFSRKELLEKGELIEKEHIPAEASLYPRLSMKQVLEHRESIPGELPF